MMDGATLPASHPAVESDQPEDITSVSEGKCDESSLQSVTKQVLDEKFPQSPMSYEEERPINLVKKIRLDDSSSEVKHPAVAETSKENVTDDVPMDLSSGTKRKETKVSRKPAIERLRDELRNEETTLLLLKKLQRSQMLHRPQDLKAADNSVFKLPVQATANKPASLPPPLVKGAPQPSVSQPMNQIAQQARTDPPRQPPYNQPVPGMQHAPNSRCPPPMLPTAVSRPPPAVRPPVTPEHTPPVPRPQAPVPTPEQTLAQNKEAAKLALRRQLEATLLQIPPPKPAALAVNFIPSIGSNVEFVSLVGLEEVVSCIVNQEATSQTTSTSGSDSTAPAAPATVAAVAAAAVNVATTTTEVRKPFQCAHCETDYTPVWRRSQASVDEILCERCAISAQKRMLKQEHTARLKAAFMHALQQEREIEASGGLVVPVSAGVLQPQVRTPSGTDPKVYPGLSQHSRSMPSFHAITDPRLLNVPSPYGLLSGTPLRPQQFGNFAHHSSDHQLAKRIV